MAEIKKGLLGPITGKVGPVVGLQYRGKNILRAAPKKSTKQASPKQIQQRNKLILVVQFLKDIRTFINAHYPNQIINGSSKVGYDQIRSTLMKEGGVWGNDLLYIQIEKVVVSMGSLPPAAIKKIAFLKNRKIKIQWDPLIFSGLNSSDDTLTVLMYNENLNQFEQSETIGKREDKYSTLVIPQHWEYGKIHFWSVWSTADKTMHSTSLYHAPLDLAAM
ncbi:DUF6266 family protein [Myroides odoratus]|uniref:DUF6266 family protein n=1 Tax=Myroides odoratus TaxID=256 RepID=UPI0039AF83B4